MSSSIHTQLLTLRNHMAKNNLAPRSPIIPDDERHHYAVKRNKKSHKASYITYIYPFGTDGPSLFCSYGLVDEGPQYEYSSLQN